MILQVQNNKKRNVNVKKWDEQQNVKERRRKGQPANGRAVDSVDRPDTKHENQTKKQG